VSEAFQLYDYQQEAISDLFSRWDAGATRVPTVAATGLGKTEIFIAVIDRWLALNPGKRVLVIAHTNELIDQAAKKSRLRMPHRRIGIVKGALNQSTADVIISSRQTLASVKRRNQIKRVGLMIVDECFPAGTLVGGGPIETLKPGDMVQSWDEASGEVVARPVVAVMRKRPQAVVRVSLAGGQVFACTPNHPILTSRGWCPAGMLARGELVVSFTHDGQTSKTAGDRIGGRNEACGGSAESRAHDSAVHVVRKPRGHAERHHSQVSNMAEDRTGVRHRPVPCAMGEPGFVESDGSDQQGARFGAHDGEQPDGSGRDSRENESDALGDRSSAANSWREWNSTTPSSAPIGGVPGVAHGSSRSSRRRGSPLSLQVGYSASGNEGVRGSGRGVPLRAGAPRLGPSEGRTPSAYRVVDVQVLESGSDGTYGGVCPDGFVYNIEVAGTHTYLIGDGVVAHNCHHAHSKNTYGKVLKHYGAFDACEHSDDPDSVDVAACNPCVSTDRHTPPRIKVAGFTATLVRGDKAKLSTVWEDCTYSRDILFGIRHGYLLDVKGERIIVDDLNLKNVKQVGGDFSESALAEELERSFAIETIAEEYARLAHDRKGIAFWPLVATAEHAAQVFNDAGIPSAAVSGQTDKHERASTLADLAAGRIQVVHNAMVLTEGFDDPSIECIVIGRPTRSPVLFPQMVGRGLRKRHDAPIEQQRPCLLFVVSGAAETMDLRGMIDLSPESNLQGAYDENPDATLGELEEWVEQQIEEELDAQRAGASYEFESEQYAGPVTTATFDPLGRDKAWGKTDGGTYYLRASRFGKGDAFIFLTPALSGLADAYDIAACSTNTGFDQFVDAAPEWVSGFPEHVDMPLERALLFSEEVAGGAYNSHKSPWHSRPPGKHLKIKAWRLGVDVGQMTHGELQEAVDARIANARIDPLVATVRSSVQ
jgi:superfamily II DNA or RNA helicase